MKTWALVFSTKRIVRRIIYDDDSHIYLSSTNKLSTLFAHHFISFSLSPYIYLDHASIHVSSLHGKDQHGGHVYQKALLSHDCRSTCVLTFAFVCTILLGDMGEMRHSSYQRLLQ